MFPQPAGCEVQDLTSSHNYRTEIPNIIFHLKLNPWAFKAYCVIKMTAGDHGKCFKSNSRMSEEVGCSIPTLIKLKSELVEQGLITIEKRKHSNGSDMPDLIKIIDIWPQNAEYMLKLYPKNPQNDLWPWKKREGKADLGGGVNGVKGEGKRPLHKQEHIQQDEKQQQEPAAAAVFSDEEQNKKGPKVYPVLEPIDIPLPDKEEITRTYSEEDTIHGVTYATQPGRVIKTCLAALIKWACKIKPALTESKEDIEQSNKKYAEKYDRKKNGLCEVVVCNKYVEISTSVKSYVHGYHEAGFMDKFKDDLRKCKFTILE